MSKLCQSLIDKVQLEDWNSVKNPVDVSIPLR